MIEKSATLVIAIFLACVFDDGRAQTRTCYHSVNCRRDECCYFPPYHYSGECVPLNGNTNYNRYTGAACTKQDINLEVVEKDCPCNNKTECQDPINKEAQGSQDPKECKGSSGCKGSECCVFQRKDDGSNDLEDTGHCQPLGNPGEVCAKPLNGDYFHGKAVGSCRCRSGYFCTNLEKSETLNVNVGTCCTK